MSEDSGESFSIEIPENEKYVRFADHFVNYVMLKYAPEYIEARYKIPLQDFVSTLHETVKRVITYKLEKGRMELANREYFQYLKDNNEADLDHYREFVKGLEEVIFRKSFSGRTLLDFSTAISNMAAFFFNNGLVNAPAIAKTYIINVLRIHMPADFTKFVLIGAEISFLGLRDPEPSLYGIVSDSEAEDEVFDQEPRDTPHSPDSEFNISEYLEKLIEMRQLKGAGSKLETSLKRSAQCSSESSEIGASPVKESKLSVNEYTQLNFEGDKNIQSSESNDKPRPDLSNIDNETVLIKRECKEKLDLSQNWTSSDNSQTLSFEEDKSIDKSISDVKNCPGQSSDCKTADLLNEKSSLKE